VVTESITAVKT